MDGYPKEMPHPDGAKMFRAFNASDEERLLDQFDKYRRDHEAANQAAFEGREYKPQGGVTNLSKRG